jgi:anti-sigma28 factor (negative regulator of flagellin synthesis)
VLKQDTCRDEDGVMLSTPLSELDLTDSRSAEAEVRLSRVRAAVRDGTYEAPSEKVAEAILASSLIGLPPHPGSLAWAC